MAAFPPIEALVPHRGAMLMLESVRSADETGIEASAAVPASAWYLDEDGSMPSWIGLELMAQAAAALAGLNGKKASRPPRPGVLLGTRAYRASVARFPRGARLVIAARLADADESGFATYDCAIRGPDGTLAEATLKVLAPADFGAFIQSAA